MGGCFSRGDGGGGRRPDPLKDPVGYAAGVAGAAATGAAEYILGDGKDETATHNGGGTGGGGGGSGGGGAAQKGDVIEHAHVEKMPDGDTLTVRFGGQRPRVRLFGVDCPETAQNYGREAGDLGRSLALGKDVRLRVVDVDRYGRLVAEVTLPDGRDLAEELVRAGAAWHYTAYSKSEVLARLERDARARKVGLWEYARPQAPWDYRRRQRERR